MHMFPRISAIRRGPLWALPYLCWLGFLLNGSPRLSPTPSYFGSWRTVGSAWMTPISYLYRVTVIITAQ